MISTNTSQPKNILCFILALGCIFDVQIHIIHRILRLFYDFLEKNDMLLQIIIETVSICMIIFIFKKNFYYEFKKLKNSKIKLLHAITIYIIPDIILFSIIGIHGKSQQLNLNAEKNYFISFYIFFEMCIAAPLTEEICFRYFLFKYFLADISIMKSIKSKNTKDFIKIIVIIILNSLFFSFLHLHSKSGFIDFLIFFFGGLKLCIIFDITDLLILSIFIHFLHNLIIFMISIRKIK